ncbi:1-aminocyclopropane-1-carboxylate deaminase/D-cysteine desulfhydrase [Polaribacter sp.]|uniref:1-aminocyclopropane-1-carboxylate deaminase/D-cysteine desulfhydrase n=1 Tax=Polaribacter sp. TaxID=1920175 RepID=UPI003F6B7E96
MHKELNSFFTQDFISENQQVHLPALEEKKVELYIKREDVIHPLVSGNKFRKFKYNLLEAKNQNKKVLLTFGGAFSNHIVANAVAGNLNGFKTIGVVRGDELAKDLEKTLATNATLREAYKNGMTFEFVSRTRYRDKSKAEFINQLKEKFGDFYLIPEGGTNEFAVQGCKEILTRDDANFDYICCAIGTGGTISGLINASEKHQKIIGFPALKGDFLAEEIKKYTIKSKNWSLVNEYHFGGYAKYNDDLIRFINDFKKQTNIQLDPIYTGKMVFGILDLVKKGYFKKNSKIIAIHTGGLQGIAGFNQKLKQKNKAIINYL